MYRQKRPGIQARPFVIIKYRTMSNAGGGGLHEADNEVRITSVGRFLRSWSLDELPELINVFRGEMSLVGPRPLLMEYLPLYTLEQARRHEVRPGITGWAQINGRNATSWEERLKLDVWYVDHQSFWLDLKILALTAVRVLQRHGINRDQGTTMPRFRGTTDSEQALEARDA